MQVSNIKKTILNDETIFSADFTLTEFPFRKRDIIKFYIRKIVGLLLKNNPNEIRSLNYKTNIWFKILTKYCKNVSPDNAFFAAAVPLALATNEDLNFHGNVSKKLFNNISKIKHYLGFKNRNIKIYVKRKMAEKRKSSQSGLLFTLGIDSFYSLLMQKNLILDDKICFFLHIFGYNVFKKQKEINRRVKEKIITISNQMGITPIFISTNLRKLSDLVIDWNYYHGAAIAAPALLLYSVLGKVYISGSDEYFTNEPYGTGKNIDRLWSTEGFQLAPIGEKKHKIDKIIELAKLPQLNMVLENIQVCWEKTLDSMNDNCSQCEKCIRTHLGFLAAGVKIPTHIFKPITIEMIKKIHIEPARMYTYNKIYSLLKKNNISKDILIFLSKVLKEKNESNDRI